jgi:antitoxin component YwqK of YwqJK toxin-antitoxin module
LPLLLGLLAALQFVPFGALTLTTAAGVSSANGAEEPVTPTGESVTATEDVGSNLPRSTSSVKVIVEQRDSNGKLRVRRELAQDALGNYLLHGKWEAWDEEGKRIAFGPYRMGERHGSWTRVYKAEDAELFSKTPFQEYRGPFVSEATFRDDKLDGKWVIYDCERRKISQWNFADGVRHGVSIWTYAAGHLMKEIPYQDGCIHGRLRVWDKNEKLVINETYQNGRKLALQAEHSDSGVKTGEGMCLGPPLVMDHPDDWWNARPARFSASGDLARHGRWISWHPNGEKRYEGCFEHGVRVGEFVWWFPNRQKRLVGSYQNGEPEGLWIWWHENGRKATKGEYRDGQPCGAWAYWNEDGKLYRKREFGLPREAIVVQPNTFPPADRSTARTPEDRGTDTADR